MVLAIKSHLRFALTMVKRKRIFLDCHIRCCRGITRDFVVLLDAKRMFCGVGYKEPFETCFD